MAKVAAIQMASGSQVTANLMEAGRLIGEAAAQGAQMVVLPEAFVFMGKSEEARVKLAEPIGSGQMQDAIKELAIKYKIWIVAGTIPIQSDDPTRAYASSLVFNNKGEQVARYDKMHLFDVELSEAQETYAESETTNPGSERIVIDTPIGRVGMAVCYDLRFPGHFRHMMEAGAELLVIPSAFTDTTGKAHWEVLVRARAIENMSYVIASAQGGFHVNGRATYGHSMIVDYWGNIHEQLGKGAGMIICDIDLETLRATRKAFPVLEHRRQSECR
ncbi:MAG: FIG003879: Predicted amidohydrolase [uncultured Thiotrichaceae bacterium]|uniref:FIG003879: Predicted amidohydrolase n=1 Tax=uncultured Thiotrichaceae bacterium TaxID=298394 RepID=A0A6S6S8E4_9GAMM|nr:MAG: FIG003879: Predicted amidohydrolase [uncultured Thiotrichaceae bacterium]